MHPPLNYLSVFSVSLFSSLCFSVHLFLEVSFNLSVYSPFLTSLSILLSHSLCIYFSLSSLMSCLRLFLSLCVSPPLFLPTYLGLLPSISLSLFLMLVLIFLFRGVFFFLLVVNEIHSLISYIFSINIGTISPHALLQLDEHSTECQSACLSVSVCLSFYTS